MRSPVHGTNHGARLCATVCAVLAAACAASERPPRSDVPCTAPDGVVENYLYHLINLTSRQMNPGIAPRRDAVTISFRLGADGSASNIRVMRASSPALEAEAERVIRSLSPYPPPPFAPEACLLGGRAEMQLFSLGRCDESAAGAYSDAMLARIDAALAESDFAALPGARTVTLDIDLDAEGAVESVRAVGPASERGEKVAALVRAVSRFDEPDASIRECVSDGPFVLWVDVPGPVAAD